MNECESFYEGSNGVYWIGGEFLNDDYHFRLIAF